jgi:hypothetical protein
MADENSVLSEQVLAEIAGKRQRLGNPTMTKSQVCMSKVKYRPITIQYAS